MCEQNYIETFLFHIFGREKLLTKHSHHTYLFLRYPTSTENDVLQIKVYDYDAVTNNDLLGELEIPMSQIAHKPPTEEWKELMFKKGPGKFEKAQGELKMVAIYMPGNVLNQIREKIHS